MFITFEGPEGSGKSTLVESMAAHLRSRGLEVLQTREPGAGDVGSAIRRILLEGSNMDPLCEVFLFLADRAQHVAAEIRPALDKGQVVLCDRYVDSTIVYQGFARGLELDVVRDLNRISTGGLLPTITFLLDLDPEAGLARLHERDRLDREPLGFHRRVRDGFLREAAREPNRWVVIDASRSADLVLADSLRALESRLDLRPP